MREEHESKTFSSFECCNSDAINSLRKYRNLNLHKLVIAHVNIDSARNKSDLLPQQIQGNVDMVLICKTQIDNNLSMGQFQKEGFNVLSRLDKDKNGGGIN